MNLKFYSLLAASLLSCSSMFADDYHGFAVNATQELIDNDIDTPLSAETWNQEKLMTLLVIYQPEYYPLMVDNSFNLVKYGTTVLGAAGSQVDYAAPYEATNNYTPGVSMAAGNIDGAVLDSEMGDDGLCYVTVPDTYYKGGKDTATPADGGDIRVRFCTRNSGDYTDSRLGDSESCHVSDITGVYVTVSAPAGTVVESHFAQANLTTQFTAKAGGPNDDTLGKVQRTAIINVGTTSLNNQPEDLKIEGNGPSDVATNSWNLLTYKRNDKDEYGFPIRFVDIVFKGVKPGERVGWANYQTLHNGYTPRTYSEMIAENAGINDITVDSDNAPVEYFNLQGVRVENPANGLFIRRQGATVTKTILH